MPQITITLTVEYMEGEYSDERLIQLEDRVEASTVGLDWIDETSTETDLSDA